MLSASRKSGDAKNDGRFAWLRKAEDPASRTMDPEAKLMTSFAMSRYIAKNFSKAALSPPASKSKDIPLCLPNQQKNQVTIQITIPKQMPLNPAIPKKMPVNRENIDLPHSREQLLLLSAFGFCAQRRYLINTLSVHPQSEGIAFRNRCDGGCRALATSSVNFSNRPESIPLQLEKPAFAVEGFLDQLGNHGCDHRLFNPGTMSECRFRSTDIDCHIPTAHVRVPR
jgi:hypothetical protein